MKDYYKILGVERSATGDELKKAYRRLAHKYHPDKQGGDENKFKEINEAYQVLSNKEKRAQYDTFGKTFDGAQGAGGNPFGGFNYEGMGGFSNIDDIFDTFFQGAGKGTKQRARRGKDIAVDLEISLEEAFKGLSRELQIRKMSDCERCKGSGKESGTAMNRCPRCQGKGQIEEVRRIFFGAFRQVIVCPECGGEGERPEKLCKECLGEGRNPRTDTIRIDVPAGIQDGETIRLSGKGEAGGRGGASGDLYGRIHILPHSRFVRKGDNLFIRLPLSFKHAALGAKIEVPTIEGTILLNIPAGTQSGKVFRISGKGMPRLQGYGRGDQLIEISIAVPQKLSRRARNLLEELEGEL